MSSRNAEKQQQIPLTFISPFPFSSGKTDSKKLTVILQIILNQLKGSIAYYLSQRLIADNLLQQRESLPNITFGPSGKHDACTQD